MLQNIFRKTVDVFAMISYRLCYVCMAVTVIYMTTSLQSSKAFTIFCAATTFFCAFCLALESEVRTSKHYKFAPILCILWALMGMLFFVLSIQR